LNSGTQSVRTKDGETVTETNAAPASAPTSDVRVARDERGTRTLFEDLEIGRDLGTMEFVVTQQMVDDSCERREDYHEWYSIGSPWGGTIAPTILNYGPPRLLFSQVYNVRGLFYKYEFENFYPIRVGKKITVTATLTDKWVRNNREFVAYEATYTDEDGNKVLHTRRAHALDYIKATQPKTGVGLDSGILR
jgi:hypothetical protein